MTDFDFEQMYLIVQQRQDEPLDLFMIFSGYPYTDGTSWPWHAVAAEHILDECLAAGGGYVPPGFFGAMMDRHRDGTELTARMTRGVLNVTGGALAGNRKRFWKSRGTRRDRDDGDPCVVCGAPLTLLASRERGCGPVCFRRVIDDLLRFR